MALDAVIFDFDGTLVDTNGLHARAWAQAFQEHGIRMPQARFEPLIGLASGQMLTQLIGAEEAEENGDALSDVHTEVYLDLVQSEGVAVLPGTRALLDAIREKGLRTAVATGSKEDEFETVLEQAGLSMEGRVDAVITDDKVGRGKPKPDVINVAAEALDVHPAQCLLVGDTPFDAKAAGRAGATCIIVHPEVHKVDDLQQAGARAVYEHPADMLDDLDDALANASPQRMALPLAQLEAFMDEALAEARAGMDVGEIPIGSVLVDGDGNVMARGFNRAQATGRHTAHAEMEAFAASAGQNLKQQDGVMLVTTLEPCVMCMGAALEGGIDSIVYALEAPDNGAVERTTPNRGPGAVLPRIVGGVKREASRAMLKRWHDENDAGGFVGRVLAQT